MIENLIIEIKKKETWTATVIYFLTYMFILFLTAILFKEQILSQFDLLQSGLGQTGEEIGIFLGLYGNGFYVSALGNTLSVEITFILPLAIASILGAILSKYFLDYFQHGAKFETLFIAVTIAHCFLCLFVNISLSSISMNGYSMVGVSGNFIRTLLVSLVLISIVPWNVYFFRRWQFSTIFGKYTLLMKEVFARIGFLSLIVITIGTICCISFSTSFFLFIANSIALIPASFLGLMSQEYSWIFLGQSQLSGILQLILSLIAWSLIIFDIKKIQVSINLDNLKFTLIYGTFLFITTVMMGQISSIIVDAKAAQYLNYLPTSVVHQVLGFEMTSYLFNAIVIYGLVYLRIFILQKESWYQKIEFSINLELKKIKKLMTKLKPSFCFNWILNQDLFRHREDQ